MIDIQKIFPFCCKRKDKCMKSIVISNERIQAEILPDFGGTVARLRICGTDVLRMDEGMLGVSNTLAGGIPFLFPFVSATPGREAEFMGKKYTMPMHGFAKDLPFDTIREEASMCEIRLASSEVTRHFYPYEFDLRLIYEIEGDALKTTMVVKNTGEGEMPYAAGFHPYFLTPDRSKTKFSFGLKEYWNYLSMDENGRPAHGTLEGELQLQDTHDTVFWNGCPDCEILCEEPAYRARIECGETLDVITICTTQKDASCIEPWQARPGAAHRREECRKLMPGEQQACTYTIRLAK